MRLEKGKQKIIGEFEKKIKKKNHADLKLKAILKQLESEAIG